MNNLEQINKIKEWLGTGSINIFGRPFSGKDAQGERLANILGGNLIGGGDILCNSIIPKDIRNNIQTGKLIPTDDYIKIVLPYLKQNNLAGKPLILSSVGRWHGEEKGVIKAINESGHTLKVVIYLDISNNESYERWLKKDINNDRPNRHDDDKEILNIRFKEFEDKTIPVIDYYDNAGILIRIDGRPSRDEVTKNIFNALYNISYN